MNRQEALAYILTLAANNIPAPTGMSDLPEYRNIFNDISMANLDKYLKWLMENEFVSELV
jgi:hypothetical protein